MIIRNTEWRKATKSDATGSCVAVRGQDGNVQVRDTKQHGEGPILSFTPDEFAAFLDGAKKGEFDDLLG